MYFVTPTTMTRGSPLRRIALGAALAAFAGAVALPSPAEARVCGPRDKIVDRLTGKFQEKQTAFGLSGNGMLTELYLSEGGTWTIVFTDTGGTSCLMAAGEDWETTGLNKEGSDAETES